MICLHLQLVSSVTGIGSYSYLCRIAFKASCVFLLKSATITRISQQRGTAFYLRCTGGWKIVSWFVRLFVAYLVPNIGSVKQLNSFPGIFCQRGTPICLNVIFVAPLGETARDRQTDVCHTDALLFPVWFFLKDWAISVQFLGEAWHMLYAITPISISGPTCWQHKDFIDPPPPPKKMKNCVTIGDTGENSFYTRILSPGRGNLHMA